MPRGSRAWKIAAEVQQVIAPESLRHLGAFDRACIRGIGMRLLHLLWLLESGSEVGGTDE